MVAPCWTKFAPVADPYPQLRAGGLHNNKARLAHQSFSDGGVTGRTASGETFQQGATGTILSPPFIFVAFLVGLWDAVIVRALCADAHQRLVQAP